MHAANVMYGKRARESQAEWVSNSLRSWRLPPTYCSRRRGEKTSSEDAEMKIIFTGCDRFKSGNFHGRNFAHIVIAQRSTSYLCNRIVSLYIYVYMRMRDRERKGGRDTIKIETYYFSLRSNWRKEIVVIAKRSQINWKIDIHKSWSSNIVATARREKLYKLALFTYVDIQMCEKCLVTSKSHVLVTYLFVYFLPWKRSNVVLSVVRIDKCQRAS